MRLIRKLVAAAGIGGLLAFGGMFAASAASAAPPPGGYPFTCTASGANQMCSIPVSVSVGANITLALSTTSIALPQTGGAFANPNAEQWQVITNDGAGYYMSAVGTGVNFVNGPYTIPDSALTIASQVVCNGATFATNTAGNGGECSASGAFAGSQTGNNDLLFRSSGPSLPGVPGTSGGDAGLDSWTVIPTGTVASGVFTQTFNYEALAA